MDEFTLDQFTVFVAVVNNGGFAAAARKLGRAQSAITYAIRGLEEQSGLVLFDRSGYRPTLTDAGRALLPRARRLVADVDDYRRQAEFFAKGLEANLTIVSDIWCPLPLIARALADLHKAHPSVRVSFVVEPFTRTREMVSSGLAQLGVLVAVPVAPLGPDLETTQWTEHDVVAVAAPVHPLASVPSPIPRDQLCDHMQLVWTPAAELTDSPEYGVHSLDRWHLTDLEPKLELLRAGAGWGTLPDHMVVEEIEAGRLVKLGLESWEGSDRMPRYSTVIARRRDAQLGPAARHLVEALRRQAPTTTTRQRRAAATENLKRSA